MSPSISSALSNRAKQKTIPAVVIDVLGNRCSVRLSGRGTKLTGLEFVGSVPKIGDPVIVDYRNANTPMVLTSGSVEVTAPQPITATVVTGSGTTPTETTTGSTQDWPPVDGQQYVAKDGDWFVLEDIDIEWPPDDGKTYIARDGGWVELTETPDRVLITGSDGVVTTSDGLRFDSQSGLLLGNHDSPYPAADGVFIQLSESGTFHHMFSFGDGISNLLKGIAIRGSAANWQPVLKNDVLLRIQGAGFNGDSDQLPGGVSSGKIVILADEDLQPGANGGRVEIYTTPVGSVGMVKALTVNSDGTIEIAPGKTYNVGGVPHTHPEQQGKTSFIVEVYEDISSQINPGNQHYCLSAPAETITLTINGIGQRISEVILDPDCLGFTFVEDNLIQSDELVVRYGTSIENVLTDDAGHILYDNTGSILFVGNFVITTPVNPYSMMDDGNHVLTDDGNNILFFDGTISLLALTDNAANPLYDDADNLLFA